MMSSALLRRTQWQECHLELSFGAILSSFHQTHCPEWRVYLLLAISPSCYSFLQHQTCIPPALHINSFQNLLIQPKSPAAGDDMNFFLQFHCPPCPCCSHTSFFSHIVLLKRLQTNSPSKTHQESRSHTFLSRSTINTDCAVQFRFIKIPFRKGDLRDLKIQAETSEAFFSTAELSLSLPRDSQDNIFHHSSTKFYLPKMRIKFFFLTVIWWGQNPLMIVMHSRP